MECLQCGCCCCRRQTEQRTTHAHGESSRESTRAERTACRRRQTLRRGAGRAAERGTILQRGQGRLPGGGDASGRRVVESEPVELLDQVLWVRREQRPRRSGGPGLRQAVRHPSYVPPGLQLPLAVQFQCPSVLQLNASERNHWRTGPERPLPAPFQAGERCCIQTAVRLGRGGASRSLPLPSTVRCPSKSCHLQRSRDVTTSLHLLATAPAHALLAAAW